MVLGFSTYGHGIKRYPLATAMFRTAQSVLVAIIVLLAGALLWGADKGLHHKPTKASGKAGKTLRPSAAQKEQSALPLSPEQKPPPPLTVTYLDGQLTIIAENSSLADILSAVSSQTGAVMDLPPGSGSDRVVSRIGPGPARDVLAALLNGSRFDYIMTGSPSNPARVGRIILIPRGDGSESTSPMGNPAIAADLVGDRPSRQNLTEIGPAQQQLSQQDVTEAATTSDGWGYAGADASEQPTTVWTSEGVAAPSGQQRSGWPMPQAFPQQPGASPQQPANSPTTTQGFPNPLPPHN